MNTSTDVLVVGGGLMGCASAFYLAKSGAKTVLVERNSLPGRETTARSGAIIRAHYGVPELVVLSIEANRRYARFKDEVGASSGFTPCGYTVLVDEADVETLRLNVEMHRELGANVSLLSPDELQTLVPSLKTDDVALACYEPEAGYANPNETVAAYAQSATKHGADLRFDSVVTEAKKEGENWLVALGNGDTISASQVVLCTGNWSLGVGELFGVHLPVVPVRAQIIVMERPESFQGSFPVVSDLINLAYFREDGASGMWVGSSDMTDLRESLPIPEGFNEQADAVAIDAARRKTALRFNGFDEADKGGIERAFCGLYETTPDWQPIIDSFDNLHVAVGFSGHGFKLAPVIGEEMASRAMSTHAPFDTSIFKLSRFADNQNIKSRHVYQRARFLR